MLGFHYRADPAGHAQARLRQQIEQCEDELDPFVAIDAVETLVQRLVPVGHLVCTVEMTLSLRRALRRRAKWDRNTKQLLSSTVWGHHLVGFWPEDEKERNRLLAELGERPLPYRR